MQATESASFDCIFMDLQMPVMDGLEAIRRIRHSRSTDRRIFIIAFTANVRPEDRQAGLEAGMNAFLSKPVRPDEITEVLRHAYRHCGSSPNDETG